MDKSLGKKIAGATKWSAITEIVAKLVSPIINMILARLFVPEVFGIVTTVTLVVSFADIFSDAGFQKYLVQHEFETVEGFNKSTTVAFWTNLIISLFLWGAIWLFSEPIASLVGNPGLGFAITVACISLPMTSFSSIQMALFRRDFDYKTLFLTRIAGIIIPFVITIPLAIVLRSYWALIIGTICGNLANAVILTLKSRWKPVWFFKLEILKAMLSFSVWTLAESVVTWFTLYVDIFIIGRVLSPYYVGIYRTSMTTINQIMALVTGAITPILFSTLSRLQSDDRAFQKMFYKFQRLVGIIVLPMGVGIFMYKQLITKLLLGRQWEGAAGFIGIWGLIGGIYIVLGNFCSEVYRAKGKPKLSVIAQIAYISLLLPTLLLTIDKSFALLYYSRAISRLLFIVIHMIIMGCIVKISPIKMIFNILPSLFSSMLMGGVAYLLRQLGNSIVWNFVSILICIAAYFSALLMFPKTRAELFTLISPKLTIYRIKRHKNRIRKARIDNN